MESRSGCGRATRLAAGLALIVAGAAGADDGDRFYLSGTGLGDERIWEFEVSAGRRAGEPSTLGVPSQWELEGFGTYAYGFHDDKPHEVGSYRYRFELPAGWSDRRVRLVFEGVMTDAAVRLNGEPLDPVHRGGFTEFSYWVTERLRRSGENLLEVEVAEQSAERSINRAERDADYWVFGGIFRPVYLEALPAVGVDHVEIDARHGGRLRLRAELGGVGERTPEVTARVSSLDGRQLWAGRAEVEPGGAARLDARVPGVLPWSAERPSLYRLSLTLREAGVVRHEVERRFGFRTVELRPDGVWINQRRVLLRGINRHSFWPESGRTLNREINFRDAELIKGMNANAVRTSHYPPDRAFLDACDEIGLYVIEELPGWHDAYSRRAGRPLVRELVRRDAYRPSVILWANGNEGGWNRALDGDYALHDLQQRPVIHPDESFAGIDTTHYLDWRELDEALDPNTLGNRWQALFGSLPAVMPTEILHGLYDGGLGAGLEDYWGRLSSSPRGAGLFLWTFVDEAVRRVDRDGELDAHGSYAPDGIVGPFRQPEGSYWALREIWSPVAADLVPEPAELAESVALQLTNRFVRTDLAETELRWQWRRPPPPGEVGAEMATVAAGAAGGPSVAPGESVVFELPRDGAAAGDLLRLEIYDPSGRSILVRDFEPVGGEVPLRDALPRLGVRLGLGVVATRSVAGSIELVADSTASPTTESGAPAPAIARFEASSGRLVELVDGESRLRFDGAVSSTRDPGTYRSSVRVASGDVPAELQVSSEGDLRHASWRMYPSGWLRLRYRVRSEAPVESVGLTLPLPVEDLTAVRWLGRGPSPVWGNRRRGGRLEVWEGTPEARDYGIGTLDLSGFWQGVRWLEWSTESGVLTVVLEPSAGRFDGRFAAFLPPLEPEDPRFTSPPVPTGLSIVHGIPSIGTKFHPPSALGPSSSRTVAAGDHSGVLWMRWRGHPAATSPGEDR